mmetsp:Transcript_13917/g.27746  ORF Transcript_13917/g.27746 Transcript_13917/m.27746 type:complete len:259 (-) Transcript_13917:181-957(-)
MQLVHLVFHAPELGLVLNLQALELGRLLLVLESVLAQRPVLLLEEPGVLLLQGGKLPLVLQLSLHPSLCQGVVLGLELVASRCHLELLRLLRLHLPPEAGDLLLLLHLLLPLLPEVLLKFGDECLGVRSPSDALLLLVLTDLQRLCQLRYLCLAVSLPLQGFVFFRNGGVELPPELCDFLVVLRGRGPQLLHLALQRFGPLPQLVGLLREPVICPAQRRELGLQVRNYPIHLLLLRCSVGLEPLELFHRLDTFLLLLL